MKFLWISAFLVFLVCFITFPVALMMQCPESAMAILLAVIIVLISSALRFFSIRFGRGSPLSHLNAIDCNCTVLIQARRMIRQLWVQITPHSGENKSYWIKAYYSPNMLQLPGIGIIKAAHKRAQVYVDGKPLLLYGKVHQQYPRLKNRQEMTLYANPLLHTAHLSRRMIIAAPFLLAVPIVGVFWYSMQQSWEDFLFACIITVPIVFWWQGFTGNNPSSQEKEYQI